LVIISVVVYYCYRLTNFVQQQQKETNKNTKNEAASEKRSERAREREKP
jgi:hypothetical protein